MKRSCHIQAAGCPQQSNSLSGFSFWFRLSTPRQTCGLADGGSLAGQVPHYNWACAPQQQARQRQHQARPAPGCQPTCHLQEDIHTNTTSDTHTHTHIHIETITKKRTKGQTHPQVLRCFWWIPRLLLLIDTCNGKTPLICKWIKNYLERGDLSSAFSTSQQIEESSCPQLLLSWVLLGVGVLTVDVGCTPLPQLPADHPGLTWTNTI